MSLDEYSFSPYGASSVAPSPVNRMMASFAVDFRDGYDINLGVGYVNERTIPRNLIGEALDAVIKDPKTYRAAFNYGNPEGSANCIESIKRFLVKEGVGGLSREILDRNRIIVGASGVTSLLEGSRPRASTGNRRHHRPAVLHLLRFSRTLRIHHSCRSPRTPTAFGSTSWSVASRACASRSVSSIS